MDLEGLTKKTDFEIISPVKLDLENGMLKYDFWLTDDIYCQFGQINFFDQINGIARLISTSGQIVEGTFKEDKLTGFCRIISGPSYSIAFYKHNKVDGYYQRFVRSETQVPDGILKANGFYLVI